jgi:hypothetical protein
VELKKIGEKTGAKSKGCLGVKKAAYVAQISVRFSVGGEFDKKKDSGNRRQGGGGGEPR